MKLMRHTIPVLLPLALAACASTPSSRPVQTFSLPEAGRVQVSWLDPDSYMETSCRFSAQGRDREWARTLAEYTRKQAERRLPAGESLSVLLKDIDRAGECEPSRYGVGSEMIRVVRQSYPPRIELSYKLTGSNRGVPAEGDARLLDGGFMMNSISMLDTDPLRYEKRVIDDWLFHLSGKR